MRSPIRVAERALWRAASPIMGSDSSHYRQALWRPTRQGLEGVALSETFGGIQGASKWRRSDWDHIGILQVSGTRLPELLAQPNIDPALAFAMGNMLVVGRIEDPEAFRRMVLSDGEPGDIAHGMRIGPDDTRFAIGGVASNGEFITPPQEDLISHSPLLIDGAIRLGSEFELINFS